MKTRKMLTDIKTPEGHEVYNAPRPLSGHVEWTGDFISGVFYAALDPTQPDYETRLDYNQRMDAVRLEVVTPDQVVTEMVEYYTRERPKVWERLALDVTDSQTRRQLIETWFNLNLNWSEE